MSNHERHGSHSSNRDAALERAWGDASDEQPPAHLDAAIIAAARKSVPDGGEQPITVPARVQPRKRPMQWQPLAAAATVAGLAFVLVQMLPREHDLAPTMQRQESAPVPAEVTPQVSSESARAATENSQLPGADKTAARPERIVVPDRAPAQSAAPAPPPVSPAVTAEGTASDTAVTADTATGFAEASAARRKAVEPQVAGRAAAAASSPVRESSPDAAAPLDAAAWAAKIAALHASGDFTAAEHALRAFRAADPDADTYLPGSLRDWARTVE
jgi:hypothetical protein